MLLSSKVVAGVLARAVAVCMVDEDANVTGGGEGGGADATGVEVTGVTALGTVASDVLT